MNAFKNILRSGGIEAPPCHTIEIMKFLTNVGRLGLLPPLILLLSTSSSESDPLTDPRTALPLMRGRFGMNA